MMLRAPGAESSLYKSVALQHFLAGADIQSLPNEVLDIIFQCLSASESPNSRISRIPSRALFPFNVASTCVLWFDILKSRSQHWQRVVIDVADDITPFLSTLTLFNPHDLETALDVIVFSSLNDRLPSSSYSEDELRARENTRARAIYKSLESVVGQCGSITVDLMYQSSLPSAATIISHFPPLLWKLSLACSTYDFDDGKSPIPIPTPTLVSQGMSNFNSRLEVLCLTGYGYMELCRYPVWIEIIDYGMLDLSITHFKLLRRDASDDSRSWDAFLVEKAIYCKRLALSEISLDYRPTLKHILMAGIPELRDLVFDGVSEEFISLFFATVEFPPLLQLLSFKMCSIPHIKYRERFPVVRHLDLELVDIPSPSPISANSAVQTGFRRDSIYNILGALIYIYHLRLSHCDGVTDELFQWLSQGEPYLAEGPKLKSLKIHDCPRFTSGGLVSLVRYCNEGAAPRETSQIRELEVSGKGPMLAQKDADWFLDEADVNWNVEPDNDKAEHGFLAKFKHVLPEGKRDDSVSSETSDDEYYY